MVEGASIDKQEHSVDGERAIWDAIEFDRAVAVALDFARRTNTDADPANDTLVIVTADHETGGLASHRCRQPALRAQVVGLRRARLRGGLSLRTRSSGA